MNAIIEYIEALIVASQLNDALYFHKYNAPANVENRKSTINSITSDFIEKEAIEYRKFLEETLYC